MSNIQSQIQAASAENTRLLQTLKETDHAPPALNEQKRYIADLQAELKNIEISVGRLTQKREAELKDHEKYRGSIMKRFAYRASRKTDKFNEKASKEEQEYFSALQAEHNAKETQRSMTASLEEAKTACKELEPIFTRHEQAQRDLDGLYNSIFAGNTPLFPDEDVKETQCQRALDAYRTVQSEADAQQQTIQILRQAHAAVLRAQRDTDNALDASRMDMFGGGMLADCMERSDLGRAQASVAQAHALMAQALRLDPRVRLLPTANIPQGNVMMDVVFDNVFSDYDFHQKIKGAMGELIKLGQFVDQETDAAKARLRETQQRSSNAEASLQDARRALQSARESAFEQVNGVQT